MPVSRLQESNAEGFLKPRDIQVVDLRISEIPDHNLRNWRRIPNYIQESNFQLGW